MKNIVIADNHPITRKGIKHILRNDPQFKIIGKAATAEKLEKLLAKDLPDILILDIDLPNLNGITWLRKLKKEYSKLVILIFSAQPEEIYALRSIKYGASGFVSKSASSKSFLLALSHVADGGIYESSKIKESFSSQQSKPSRQMILYRKLSGRETEVLNLLSSGSRNKDIAIALSINEKTVSTYKTRLLKKLGAKSLAELITQARLFQIGNS